MTYAQRNLVQAALAKRYAQMRNIDEATALARVGELYAQHEHRKRHPQFLRGLLFPRAMRELRRAA